MATVHEGRIGEQHEAYRKGMVLGLTMAEVAILIIFVLLLLLVFQQFERASVLGKFDGMEPVSPATLTRLTSRSSEIDSIAAALGVPVEDSSEDYTRLVRALRQSIQQGGGRPVLTAANQGLQEIAQARREVAQVAAAGRMEGPEALARHVEQLSYVIANQQGEIQRLQNRLATAGNGSNEHPSCWAQQGGVIDYLYDVVLTSTGIKMKERQYGYRQQERALISVAVPDPGETLSEQQFLDRTAPWYAYSQDHDCRFFVVVYDATGANEKQRYKVLLKTVEGHFYKFLDDGPAPF